MHLADALQHCLFQIVQSVQRQAGQAVPVEYPKKETQAVIETAHKHYSEVVQQLLEVDQASLILQNDGIRLDDKK